MPLPNCPLLPSVLSQGLSILPSLDSSDFYFLGTRCYRPGGSMAPYSSYHGSEIAHNAWFSLRFFPDDSCMCPSWQED